MILQQSMRSGLLSAFVCLLLLGSFGSQIIHPAYSDTHKAIQAFNQQNYKTAFQDFLSSAQARNAEAQVAVGSMLIMKINPPGSGTYADAEAWLLRAAKQGNIRGMAWLGEFYYNDAQRYNPIPNSSNAFGNTLAGTGRLTDGRMAPMAYVSRPGINPSMSSGALSSFFGGRGRIPQQSGSANAPWVATRPNTPRFSVPPLNSAVRNGPQIQEQSSQEASFQKARYWFQKAAENGHAYAMEKLATLMDSGMGGPSDPKGAAQWRARMRQNKDKNFTPNAINYPIEP